MPHRESKHWWTRPCGVRDVLTLALPLVVSTASWTVMHFIDRMFLLWHSVDAFAAAMPAGMVSFAVACFPLGLAAYVNTFVAQYHGAGHPQRIGRAVWQGVWLGVLSIPLFLATIPLAPWLFGQAGHEPLVQQNEVIYYRVLSLGAGAHVIGSALAALYTGRGLTRVVMIVDSGTSALNVGLDWLWIFGHWGFPVGGIEGAAWATVVAQWARVGAYVAIIYLFEDRRRFGWDRGWRWNPALMRRIWRFGAPSALQMVTEMIAFTGFIMLVGRLGEDALAATNLAFNINGVAFIPLLGMGMAVSTIVGQQQGRRRPDLAARGTWTSLWMAMVYVGGMAVLYVLMPDVLMMGHAAGTDSTDFLPLRNVVVVLLRFVAAYCLFDAMNIVFVSALKGAGDTRFILITTIIMSPVPVLLTWAGIVYWQWNVVHCWMLVTAWICSLGLVYLGRFLQGRWRTMRVIEHDVELTTEAAATDNAEDVVLVRADTEWKV